ncbi:MAG: mandelate racemase/muconate lactonizing enzyme family protein [Chloroflexi bacterium]|nr:mandelate racemase/muconate lactonizing enzyme family protein [Chloroflexota bacterium]
MALKITNIKTFIVDGGFRPWTFVKVETSDPGVVGWGDCSDWGAPGPITATVDRLAEFVVGRDPMQVEAIWWDLHNVSIRHTAGIASKAMSGIDSALWDIRGKVLNAPVWQLLGGKMRDELRLYWSHCGSTRARPKFMTDRLGVKQVQTTDDLREVAQEVKDRGYTAIKTNLISLKDRPDALPIKPGLGDSAPAGDAPASVRRNAEAVVGTFREELGPDIGIALDVAFSFKLGGTIKLAQALEPFDMMWLETETFDAEALRVIRDSTTTTICTGESIFGTTGYRPFLQNYSQDIIMPDLAWNGITMGKKIADLANAYDTLFAPHNCHSPINTLVSAAVDATVPNFFIQEFDVDDAPWRDDIMTHPFEIKNGHLQITDRPGLGSDLIEEELLKHPPIEYPGAR